MTPSEELAQLLKESRVRAGFRSQASLARELHLSRPVLSRAENPAHPPPSDDVLVAWARATDADLKELREISSRASGETPEWFVPYRAAESQATVIRCWGLDAVPGLFQTEGYARAILSADGHSPKRLAELVKGRLERQEVLTRARVIAVIDSRALRDPIGAPAVMAEQCARLARVAEMPDVSLYVVPEGVNTGVHAALDIAARGSAVTVCLSTALDDVTTTAPDQIDKAMVAFERLIGAALPLDGSLECLRHWEATWKERI